MRHRLVWSAAGLVVSVVVIVAGSTMLDGSSQLSRRQVAEMMKAEGVTYGDCVLPTPGAQPVCTATPKPPMFAPGVYRGEQDGPNNAGFNQNSEWAGYDAEGNQVIVGVGSRLGDNQQGVVFVDDIGNVSGDGSVTSYDSPGRDGSLDILRADGSTLFLQAADGKTWTFDVFTGTFSIR